LNAAVKDPSSAGWVSSIDSLSFSATRPLGVFIVGMMRRRTSVPRRTAMSPPSSIFCGSSPVYAGK
jgi:hypothetical protein